MRGIGEERLRFIFTFVVLYGCILFLIRLHPTRAQTVFRLALIAGGIAGLVWMQMRKRRG